MSLYVPLWCKSNFSFLEGASHPDEFVDEAYWLGLPALALTDRDGYANLCQLITKGRLRSEKGESVATWDEVCAHASGLVALWGGDQSLVVGEAAPDQVAGKIRDA